MGPDRDLCVAQVKLTISYELSACLIILSAAFLKSLPTRVAPQAKRSLNAVLLKRSAHLCFSYLPLPQYYKFSRGKLLQPHRPKGVQLRSTDTDFSAQSQLPAIIKTR